MKKPFITGKRMWILSCVYLAESRLESWVTARLDESV